MDERAGIGRRRFLGGAAATAGLLLLRTPGALAAPPTSPRLSYGPDAARSMRLAWSTPTDAAGLVAELGVDDGFGRTLPVETRSVQGYGVRYHHVLADALEPGTTYTYRLAHDGGSSTGTFRTAPVDAEPYTFVAFGDQGHGAVATAVDAAVARIDPALVFLVGDLSYASKTGGLTPADLLPPTVEHGVWDAWLGLVARSGGTRTPWLAGVGNHEMEDGQGELGYDGYLARVPLPGNGPPGVATAWSARHGNVAFVNLDANDVSYELIRNHGWTGGAQTAWLGATLAGLRADPGIDWIVVGFHHCAYCSNAVHGSDGGVRDAWGALFDEHQVDLVVNGHNHCYERAHPVRGGAMVGEVARGGTWSSEAGTTYLTAGGGGQASYPTFVPGVSYVSQTTAGLRIPELATWSAFRDPANSFVAVDVEPPGAEGTTTLTIRAITSSGAELERISLVRRRAVAVSPAAPAAAPAPAPAAPEPVTDAAELPATGRDDRGRVLVAAAATTAALAARGVTRAMR
jgi:hypothetical protein